MRKTKYFQQSEIIYLFLSIIAISILVYISINPVTNNAISSLNPIWQFLIINLGLYFTFFFIIESIALKKKRIWEGTLGSVLTFIAMDLVLPEYHVTTSGLIQGGVFGASSSDYFFGYIYQQLFGLSGISLVIAVYIVTFTLLVVLGSILFKDFVKGFK